MGIEEIRYGPEFRKLQSKDTQSGHKIPAVNNESAGKKASQSSEVLNLKNNIENIRSMLPDVNQIRDHKVKEIKQKIQQGYYDKPEVAKKISDLLVRIFKKD